MHEFKHGELKSGRNGRGGKVKSRRQAIAIALEEAGASRYESGSRDRHNLRRTERARTEVSCLPLAKTRRRHSAGALCQGKAQGYRRPFKDEQAAVGKRARFALE
jgi:hypothetical protein